MFMDSEKDKKPVEEIDDKIERKVEEKLDEKIERKVDEKMNANDQPSSGAPEEDAPADTEEAEPSPPGRAEEKPAHNTAPKGPVEKKIEEKVGRRVGEKPLEKIFTKSYTMRESFFVLVGRILLAEIVFGVIYAILSLLLKPEPLPPGTAALVTTTTETADISYYLSVFTWLNILNIAVVILILLVWYNRRYIISPQEVYYVRGIILRRKDVYHIQAMVAVRVRQGVFGRIFGFGTIRLESPLLKKDVFIRNIQNPHKHAQVIENQRVKSIKSIVTESVIPKPS